MGGLQDGGLLWGPQRLPRGTQNRGHVGWFEPNLGAVATYTGKYRARGSLGKRMFSQLSLEKS